MRRILIILIFHYSISSFAQNENSGLIGSSNIKFNLISGNLEEIGLGFAYQKYFSKRKSFQISTDLLVFPQVYEDIYMKGMGIRIMPEIRIHLGNRDVIPSKSLYLSGAAIVKYNRFNHGAYFILEDHDGNSIGHSAFFHTNSQVFAYGLAPGIGIEGFMGSKQRITYDITFNLGFLYNHLYQNPPLPPNIKYPIIFLSTNTNNLLAGATPYWNIRFAIGYRFFG